MEIERKFLVGSDAWRKQADGGALIEQGYLSSNETVSVRIRIKDRKIGYLTIKSGADGISRDEIEYEIPIKDAKALLKLCGAARLTKRRYRLKAGRVTWEIDEYRGRHKGLVVAEVELKRKDQRVTLPDWIGEEVSEAAEYRNSYLAQYATPGWAGYEVSSSAGAVTGSGRRPRRISDKRARPR